MLRSPFDKSPRKERRHHPVPKRPPMPVEYDHLYQHALRRYHQVYCTRRAQRYKVSKTRNQIIWALRRWLKFHREDKHWPGIIRHIAYCYAHLAVIDSRN